jgi:phosphatidylinositol-3-phosphatase
MVLVLVFLGFGTLLGSAAGSGGAGSATARRHLKLVLPATTASDTSTRGGEQEAESEPPAAEEQSTPEPAEKPATKTTAAAEPKSKGEGGGSSTSGESTPKLPAIKHVFVIMLSNEPYAATFGPESKDHYLAHTLEGKGELLVRYDAVAHEELANEIALLSGQGPTVQTAGNCPVYDDLLRSGTGSDEQVLGEGCVYPSTTKTLPGQLTAEHLSWRAYVQGSDESGTSVGVCSHPTAGASDPTSDQTQSTGAYATFRNPLVYFHSILDSSLCAADEVGLSRLASDLAKPASTPSFAYIVPDRCHDGNPTPCTVGAPAGPATADSMLEQVVPEIMASKAYKQGGLIAITVDEAPSGGEFGDSSSCCGQPHFPNLVVSSAPGGAARGGGAVGALLLSPFIKAATTSQETYDHFSLLRTIEDLFAVPHLGYAALSGVKPLSPSLFTSKPKS